MSSFPLHEILRLSVSERIQLAEDIWESVIASGEELPVTEAQRQELDRRLAAAEKNPDDSLPWDEVRARLQKPR